jgi:pimeloyl-ACP methyl ester carboxylesterase
MDALILAASQNAAMTPLVHPYQATQTSQSHHHRVRGATLHLRQWGELTDITADRPALVLLHGWMDVSASFQFMVDALGDLDSRPRCILAPDWRGFGLSDASPSGTYWFPDYLADLEALLDVHLEPVGAHGTPIDLLGHSLGGNVAMVYAGVRPDRIRRLINIEGFGLPQTTPDQAPSRYARWLDELKAVPTLRGYAGPQEVAQRLIKNNPRLGQDRAHWLAHHWAAPDASGQWQILGDPAHKRPYPVLYRAEESTACWARITAPVLWVEGKETQITQLWEKNYPRSEFEARLQVVSSLQRAMLSPAGHMVHHDQPLELARLIQSFLGA